MIVVKTNRCTVIMQNDDIFLRTKRRHMKFKTLKCIHDMSLLVLDNTEYRHKAFPKTCLEEEEDGLVEVLQSFRTWYETRKSRAKVHLRMVGKLLYWHKLSVEKLWDPSNPANWARILEN